MQRLKVNLIGDLAVGKINTISTYDKTEFIQLEKSKIQFQMLEDKKQKSTKQETFTNKAFPSSLG